MSTSLKTRVELMFGGRCQRPPQGVSYASGRIVLLGEHLDHQGGRVLAAPTPEGVACAWGVRPDSRVVLWGMNVRQKDSFQQGEFVKSGRSWADLARGACARVSEGRARLPGIDLMVQGDLPIGEGLASSAAYLVVILRSLYEAVGAYRSKWELSEDVPAIEREWLGVRSGPMDPYCVAALRPGQVIDLECAELNHEVLHLPAGHELTAEDTGVVRRLADTPYNERLEELAQALREIRAVAPEVTRLVDLTTARFEEVSHAVAEPARRRARHVVTESQRVAQAAEALASGDAEHLGRLLLAGHESLSSDFESSTDGIDRQVRAYVEEEDVLGARLQGAGWGGRLAVLRRRR